MITLTTIIFLWTIIGWIIRNKNAKKGVYEINPFLESPTLSSVILLLCTLYSIVYGIYLIITYLP